MAIAFLAGFLLLPAAAHAANGDCSQPVSNGSNPVSSDCQFILKVAVGIESCSPECICAPTGDLPAQASDALLCLRKAVGQGVTLNCPCGSTVEESDNFNDNSKDPQRWGADETDGNGELDETGGVLEYTASPATDDDFALRPWVASQFPYGADWEAQIDVFNSTEPVNDDEVTSYGLSIVDSMDFGNEIFIEIYASSLNGPPARNGFYGELQDDNVFVNFVDTSDLAVEDGAVRIAFEAGEKVFTLFYDINPGNGYDWQQFGSFGVDGNGGSDDNADWDMTSADRFEVSVYGFSASMVVGSDQMFGDNFMATGGVE
jgi:hypothetical protein